MTLTLVYLHGINGPDDPAKWLPSLNANLAHLGCDQIAEPNLIMPNYARILDSAAARQSDAPPVHDLPGDERQP